MWSTLKLIIGGRCSVLLRMMMMFWEHTRNYEYYDGMVVAFDDVVVGR